MKQEYDVIVVGGGLAGLTAATFLGRGGKSVLLMEKSRKTGGRAITDHGKGFYWNLGPHALYRGGEAFKILRELGIRFSGGSPSGKNGHIIKNGNLHQFPYNVGSLVKTDLFQHLKSKWEFFRFYANLKRLATDEFRGETLQRWLDDSINDSEVRQLVAMLIRVATYTNDAENLSAGAALKQVQLASSGNVLYVDGGWQTLANGLREASEKAGVKITAGAKVIALNRQNLDLNILASTGERYRGRHVVLAVGPSEASELVKDYADPRALWNALRPVKMACLTVGLKRLPNPRCLLAFGYDSPLYFSVHTNWANLTDIEGAALIHCGKYLTPGHNSDPETDQLELEAMLNLCQPGWRQQRIASRYLPNMTVTNAAADARLNGVSGRPAFRVNNMPGIYLCGDWVGNRGMLCDASLASAKGAAEAILAEDNAAMNRHNSPEELFDIGRSA